MIGTSDGKQYESEVNYHLGIEVGEQSTSVDNSTDHSKSSGPVTENKNIKSETSDYEDHVWDLHNPEHREGLRSLMDELEHPSSNVEDVRDKPKSLNLQLHQAWDKGTDAIMAAGKGLNTAIDKTENTLAHILP